MWTEKYEQLNDYNKHEFKRILHLIMKRNYLVRQVYKRETGVWEPTNPDYRKAAELFPIMDEYLRFSGWELKKDDNIGVISIVSTMGENVFTADRFTTLFLYTCRIIYEEAKMEGKLTAPTTTEAVFEKMETLHE